MAKRGYKLQEFVAHTANVNCLKIGKKTHRNFITGGDDEKVNLWSVGKPTATTSLSGHTSPIESVAFDSTEVLVAAGASSGVIKLWDLEETKVVRTLNGHRSYCTALEFHPFGEFFASGSMDTNLKIWDIRKKGCIHTYKGHRRAVNTIRFSPDGRWVVSGGLDNVVKIWDLTAGKLLHEFTSHEGHIRSMDFHPLECLLATGSSDKTVKFWDLETFELIGSSRPEATAVRSITFHPDGRTLFCGLDSSLKVYSWEPVICHDSLDMGWSTLGDLCIDDGKLLGCSYYQNFVAVWVADILHLKLQGNNSILADENTRVLPKLNLQQDATERVGSPRRSTISLDDDTKDIKNIYVDSMTPVASRKSGPLPTVLNSQNPKEINNVPNHRQVTAAKFIGQADGNSFMPDDNSAKDSVKSGRESMVNEQDNTVVSLKPAHRRRPSTTKLDIVEGLSKTAESGSKCGSDTGTVANFQKRVLADAAAAKDSSEEKSPISTCVMKEVKKDSFPGDRSDDSNKELKAVKYVNGVAVVHGRTRSLVERFEKREKLNTDESQISDLPAPLSTSTNILPTRVNQTFDTVPCEIPETKTSPDRVKTPDNVIPSEDSKCKTPQMAVKTPDNVMPSEEPKCKTPQMAVKTPDVVASESKTLKMSLSAADLNDMMPENGPDVVSNAATEAKSPPRPQKRDLGPNIKKTEEANFPPVLVVQRPRTAPSSTLPEKGKVSPMQRSANSRRVMAERVRPSPMLVTKRLNASPRMIPERTKTSPMVVVSRHDTPNRVIPQKAKSSPLLDDIPQSTGRGLTSKKEEDDDSVVEILMQNHDVYITSLRSRLTKLQVVRHFWEQNDTRGAINALRKLPDHAVQADVVNVLMERMESLTLDHFSSLLPVLLDLLDSSTERHINVSLELILKLVAVFGPVITSTISAPPTVGVDLHAEKRRECCTECHEQLQRIHKCLPTIIRRGGLPARCAQELNVILQKS